MLKESHRLSTINRAESDKLRAEAEALGNLTMEGLVELAKQRPQLMESLNHYMRRRHGVWIGGIGEDPGGILTIVVLEKCPAPKRRCR